MTSIVWASLDILTIAVATVLALRIRVVLPQEITSLHVVPYLLKSEPRSIFLYIGWFAACLIFLTRSYGLYGPIQNRSGLHEMRMTAQASLTAGLLLCGALYLFNGVAISRIVVALVVVLSAVLLSIRRGIWRWMAYNRFRDGIETRNVLIVGAGRVGYALRNHLESLRHLGFRFKGFVALTEREAESGDAEVI
ncbi:MAG TPA: sugar transferase, partial [Edaphobacter sp.]|nr:sugar transferase [Edaphobacter sp.]